MNKVIPVIRILSALLFLGTGLFIASCDSGPTDTVVTIKTQFGDMVAILYDETPKHKANFIKLAREHYFDGTLFHRVIKDFMIQGGDPDSKSVKPGEHLGNGGPGYTIPPEFNPKFYHVKGAISAARQPDEINPGQESSGSQFFIVQGALMHPLEAQNLKYNKRNLDKGLTQVLMNPKNKALLDSLKSFKNRVDDETFQDKIFSMVPDIEAETGIKIVEEVSEQKFKDYTTVGGVPYLDGQYTVFGRVIKGLEIIDKIAAQPGGDGDRPLIDIPMSVTVEEMPRTKITRLYGYQYPEK